MSDKLVFSTGCYLDSVDDVVSVQAGSQFVDRGSVNVLQPAEQTSVQVQPVLLQATQVEALDKLLQLIDDLIHLQTEDVLDEIKNEKESVSETSLLYVRKIHSPYLTVLP